MEKKQMLSLVIGELNTHLALLNSVFSNGLLIIYVVALKILLYFRNLSQLR